MNFYRKNKVAILIAIVIMLAIITYIARQQYLTESALF